MSSGIITGGDANPKKAVTESANAWVLGGNTIGTDSNKLGTLDDVDVDIIRGAVRFIHLVKGTTTIEDAINLWNKIGFTRDGGFFFQNPLNNTAFRLIWDNINNLNALEFGNGAGDTMAIAADVYLPLQPNLSSLGTDANGKIIAGTGGGGGTQTLTKAQLDTAITNSTLTPGAYYFITGVDVNLYGGTTVLLQATSTNTIGSAGYGFFYTPDYNTMYIWESTGTYALDDVVVWGGYVWQNLTGNTGTSVDDFTLDATNWQQIPFNPITYNVWWDEIKYSYADDLITYRADKFGNVLDGVLFGINNYGYSPIKVYRWGNGNYSKNTIIDGFFNLVNSKLSAFNNNYFSSFCRVESFIVNNSCSINNTTWGTNCSINNTTWGDGCFINNTTWSDNCYIASTWGYSCYIDNTIWGDGCFINITTFSVGCVINNTTWGDYCYIESTTWGDYCHIQNTTWGVDCYIANTTWGTNCRIISTILAVNTGLSELITQNRVTFSFTTGYLTQTLQNISIGSNVTLNQNLSTATTIYQTFYKTIFNRQDGTPRLSYYNNSDVQVIVPVDN